jgi:uncharacterized membrane protein
MKRSWLFGAVLALSLAGNAFLGGWLAARPPATATGLALDGNWQRLQQELQRLPSEQRQQVRGLVRQRLPQLRELRQANQDNRERLRQLLGADALDAAAVQGAFARQRESTAALQQAVQRLVLDIAGQLSVEQRQRLLAGEIGPIAR